MAGELVTETPKTGIQQESSGQGQDTVQWCMVQQRTRNFWYSKVTGTIDR
jgi:hypothetical protein